MPQSGGVTPINQSGTRTENPRPAIHHNFFSMSLLIIETQHELPMILGTAGDAVGTDRTGTKAR